MKSVIAFITAALFSVTAFAQAPAKKEEKKADAKPAATAKADAKKEEAKPAPKKEEAKK